MQRGQAETVMSGDRNPANLFSITPDGTEAVVMVPIAAGGVEQREFDFVSLETGQVSKRVAAPANAKGAMITPDGQNIAFRRHERGVDNVWLQPVSGGAPIRLTDFHLSRTTSQGILSVAWSPNGKRFGLSRVFFKGDVVLLHDQGK